MQSPFADSPARPKGLINTIFSRIERLRPSDRLILKISLLVFFVSLVFSLLGVNERFLVNIPHTGGALTEGIVGTPRFINPLLAVTPADKSLVALVYSGLVRLGDDGTLVNDLAESITVSDDSLTYSIVLKEGITFHDGTPVTSDDVIFTVARAQDPAQKSPLLASWEGVTTERVNEREFNFVLQKPYAPFMENLTLGILPKHIWEEASADAFPFSQYNSEPIGSGPYKIQKIKRSTSGIPESYVLSPFPDDTNGIPRISTFTLIFYPNETNLITDFKAGLVDSVAGLSAEGLTSLGDVSTTHTVHTVPLPRTFAVFFNQNETPVFRDKAVRQALSRTVDRAQIIDTALGGFGYQIATPFPPMTGADATTTERVSETTIDEAKAILRTGGWKFDEESGRWKKKIDDVDTELTFKLATANTEILERTADIVKQEWERIGAVVEVEKYEQVDLTQTIIRPRKYQALLFGTVIGREQDFYPFWHSSQRNDPGLNVALYANLTTDAALAEARATKDPEKRAELNNTFASELNADVPALFLFVPSFTYLTPKRVHEVNLTGLAEPYERYATIRNWYIETDSVWPFFAN